MQGAFCGGAEAGVPKFEAERQRNLNFGVTEGTRTCVASHR